MIVDLRRLVDHLPTAVYVCEAPSGIIRLYNRRAVELWGREPAPGSTDERFYDAFRLFRPDGALLGHAETPMADVLRHGGERDEDVIIERPDGARVTVRVNVSAISDQHGRVLAAVNVLQDIGARKRAEEDAARLAAIVANADDAIVSKSLDGRIMSWNRAAEAMFGYAEAEVLGKSITVIIPPDRLSEEEVILSRLKRGEAIQHFETVRVAKDGRRISISLTVSPVRDHEGRIIGASKVARDITRQKQWERERDDLLAREIQARTLAQAANQAKDEFLAMLAHELRNPLGVIVNAVASFEDGGDLPPQYERARRVIKRQAQHLARMIDDLLDVARIAGGHVRLDRECVDLRSIAEQSLESARHHIERKRQRVVLSLADRAVAVIGDAVRLQQIVGNLLSNASKYTQPGGSIWIAVAPEDEEAVLKVRDNGVGIPTDRLESIFELFAQVNPTLARTEGGLGIGLTLVKRLVELHGGRVKAASEGAGRGAEFVVRLPLAREALPSERRPVETVVAPQHVLVIEDNDDGREMLGGLLRIAGHEVREARTGAEGIEMALNRAPTVVLIDIGLPDVDGYEVGRRLRQRLGRRVRLVALTGYGQPQDRARSAAAGFDEHVVKPVDPSKLAQILQRP
ncbi:MAG TPA: PAS domain S-box protein [Candidatus Deferrimicrobiaceae bacterium]|nr:PAS domain S-box protein [Candidatus Deferrimicrobiaceae bacterium]